MSKLSRLSPIFAGAILALSVSLLPSARAGTLWTGPIVTYSGGNPDVLVSGKVSLARGSRLSLYNPAAGEQFDSGNNSPLDTMWALGALSDGTNLSYQSLDDIRSENAGTGFDSFGAYLTSAGPFVVHLVNEDIFLQVTFTAWNPGGSFTYQRTSGAVVVPTPTVSVTNPAPNTVFSAPANVKLRASASVSSGTVTNVAFFNGNTLLGSVKSSPFNLTVSNLAANTYAFKAVATAAGVSGTSTVVNISVVTPVVPSNSVPAIAANHFSFDYSVNAGLTYIINSSPDLVTWTPIATNVASGSSATFTDSGALSTNQLFYDVVLKPNP